MRNKSPVLVVLIFLISGCAEQSSESSLPEPRPLAGGYEVFTPAKTASAEPQRFNFEEPNGNLTLRDAVTLTLLNNPELAAFSWEIRAQDAKEIQAGLIPNPELGLETEQFGGTGENREFDSAQTNIQIGQLIETAEKRLKRKNVAALDKTLAGWDYEAKRLDVFTDAGKAFIDVLALQERVALETELATLFEQFSITVSERVKAGKVSPLEETKANVALANVKIELVRIKSELNAAQQRLASFWGSSAPEFTTVEGNLFDFGPLPDAEQIARLLSQNPDIARWSTELKQRRAAVELEKAKAVPDVTLAAGTQYFNNTDDQTLIVGLTIPLPFFDRNQGGVEEAQSRLSKGYHENHAADIKVRTAFARTYQSLSASFKQATYLKNEIVPGAHSAFDASTEGYREGKFSYLDVLDSQRTLFEAKGQYIEVLATYHKSRADLERLIGRKIGSTTKEAEEK